MLAGWGHGVGVEWGVAGGGGGGGGVARIDLSSNR